MSRLVLAENTPYLLSQQAPVYASKEALIQDNYIAIPNDVGGIDYIREDILDALPDAAYQQVMDVIEPYNTDGMSGLFSKWRERRQEKREQRQENKIAKINARAAGREKVAKAGGGIGGILQKVAGALTGDQDSGQGMTLSPGDQKGLQIQYSTEARPWYQNPAVLIGGAAALGLGIYLATRKKKK